MNLFYLNIYISLISTLVITLYLIFYTDIGWNIISLPIFIIVILLMVIFLRVRSK